MMEAFGVDDGAASGKPSLTLADCQCMYDSGGQPFGHYIKSLRQWGEALGENYDVHFAVSQRYAESLNVQRRAYILPWSLLHDASLSRWNRFVAVLKEFRNVLSVLRYERNLVVFQSNSFMLIPLALMLSRSKCRVFITIYGDHLHRGRRWKVLLKTLAWLIERRRVCGLITGVDGLDHVYGVPCLVLPDYFPDVQDAPQGDRENDNETRYDVVVLGINKRSKDLVDIVRSFEHTQYRVLIAGRFSDATQLQELEALRPHHVEIVNKYLSRDEYAQVLHSTRFVALPYVMDEMQSSGVFYEALYASKPVLCRRTPFLNRVTLAGLGIVYESSMSEVLPLLDDETQYQRWLANVKAYVATIGRDAQSRLVSFLRDPQQSIGPIE